MKKVIPYKNAKPMYFAENIEDKELLKEIVINTCKILQKKKKVKRKRLL